MNNLSILLFKYRFEASKPLKIKNFIKNNWILNKADF